MPEQKLTPSQQEIGLKRYLWFTRINALSFGCLADNILILFAIKIGADDFLIGMLASFFYLTMPFMFLGKQLVGSKGAARTYAISWIFRNASATLMIAVPIVIEKFDPTVGLSVLTLSSFGFFSFRSMGLTANTPIIGEITNKSNRGHYISQMWLHFNLSYLFIMTMIILILRQSEQLYIFQVIIAFGSLTGMISASIIYRVPETQNTFISGKKPIKSSISYVWQQSSTRKLFFAWIATVVIVMLIVPFSMVALKKGYKISDDNALLFALFQIFGAIAASFLNRIVLDRVGPRPMLILYVLGLWVTSFLWIIAPLKLILFHPIVIFLLTGACRAGAMTSLGHYFLATVPGEERVGANMVIEMISGAIGGVVGTFIGGGLLKILPAYDFIGLHLYRCYFLIILLIMVPLLFVVWHIERIADWRIRDVLGIFVSFRDIRALFTLHRLEK